MASNRKKTIVTISVIVTIIISIVLLNAGANANKRAEVNAMLVGKTFSGECHGSIGSSYYCELKVTFISKTHCNINICEALGSTIIDGNNYTNIPYKLSGGTDGVELVWDKSGPACKDPFEVRISGNNINLYCPRFDSNISLTLRLE